MKQLGLVILFLAASTVIYLSYLPGCGGSGVGLDEDGNPIANSTPTPTPTPSGTSGDDTTGDDTAPACSGASGYTSAIDCSAVTSATFTEAYATLSSCVGCHNGGQAPNLKDKATAYTALVGIASSKSGIDEVTASCPDDSFLILKIEDVTGYKTSTPMTLSNTADICKVRAWILGGALND